MAFLAVFIVHGPRFRGAGPLKTAFNDYAIAGSTGLCLFFFLSSYLITELLIRERNKTGAIHLKGFYVRRILRIWPLYFLGVGLAVAWGFAFPRVRLDAKQIAELALLVGWMGGALAYNPFGVLWSISVEELFYAVWPALAKRGLILVASVLLIPIALLTAVYASDGGWYNPVVHFLYFATGALVAITLQGRKWACPAAVRGVLLLSGVAFWILEFSPPVTSLPLHYVLGDLGCLALFFAVLHMPGSLCPKPLVYLGKISYGLYVFHASYLFLSERIIGKSRYGSHDLSRFLLIDGLAMGLTIVTAALSYRFFETPFLRLKQRFEYIKSRAV